MLSASKFFIVPLCILPLGSVGFAQIQAKPETAPVTQPLNGAVSDEADGLTLLARFDKANYKPLEPIALAAVLQNRGTTNVSYWHETPHGMFGFTVTGPNGKATPLTEYGKRAVSGSDVSRPTLWVAIQPGKEDPYIFTLNRLYDVSMEGEYKISVSSALVTRGDVVEWDKNMSAQARLKTIKSSRFVSKTATITVNPH